MAANLIPVQSSNLKFIGYDADESTLIVVFHSGSSYEYSNVSQAEFDNLLASESKGRCLASTIKGKKSYRQIS